MRRAAALFLTTLGATLLTAAAAHAGGFQSPSGNIGCYVYADGARCDVRSHTFKPPPRPRSCEGDYGNALSILPSSKRGRFVCHGDTALNPKARKLAYGSSVTVGRLRCKSTTAGITCKNRSGHGFFVAKEKYRLF